MKQDKKKRRSVYDYEQPFDLFEEFERGPNSSRKANTKVQDDSKQYKILFLAGFFVAIVVSGFGYLGVVSKEEVKKPFVLLELRGISESGNPVAGAEVYLGKKKFGVTDSFGEWRRYLRLQTGLKLKITMKKKTGRVILFAEKEVYVPGAKTDEGLEPEIKMSLELRPNKSKVSSKLTRKPLKYIKKNNENQKAEKQAEEDSKESGLSFLGQKDSSDFADSKEMTSIDIKMNPFRSRYGTLMEAHQSRVLGVKVVPEMIGLAHEDGLSIKKKANLKYEISYIPHRGQVGFIKGTLRWKQRDGTEVERHFLRDFSKTIVETAENLLRLGRLHINRPYMVYKNSESSYVLGSQGQPRFWKLRHGLKLLGSEGSVYKLKQNKQGELTIKGKPCKGSSSCILRSPSTRELPPNHGWVKQKVQFDEDLPFGAEVYIGGFQAFGTGNRFDYWGKEGKALKLTVLKGQDILFRSKIMPSNGRYSHISLPKKLARR